jgi:preprotein translocase subunit SecF
MRLFKKTNINFMAVRGKMYIMSSAIIVVGLISLFIKGVNYGIDFRGGTELVMSFSERADYGQLREALGKAGFSDS